MSLILDALKKLEREKVAGEPGVVVVRSVPWGERGRTRRRLVLGTAALVVIVLAMAGMWLFTAAPARSPAPAEPTQRPQAQPGSATPVAPPASTKSPAPPMGALAPPPDRRLSLPAPAAATTPATVTPGARPTPHATRAPELRLNAISQRDGRPLALINDHLVFEGDSFDGIRILRIGETEVEIEVDGKRRVLRF